MTSSVILKIHCRKTLGPEGYQITAGHFQGEKVIVHEQKITCLILRIYFKEFSEILEDFGINKYMKLFFGHSQENEMILRFHAFEGSIIQFPFLLVCLG